MDESGAVIVPDWPDAAEEDFGDVDRDLLEPVALMARDIKRTANLIDRHAASFLTDMYYRAQRDRIRLANQIRALKKAGHSTAVIEHFYTQAYKVENQVKAVLGTWAKQYPEGEWSQSILGIGPVLSAALCAYIDIEKAHTVGHIWGFAGLNPNVTWNKGEKRPWNAQLKTVFWKIGQSFIKVSNNERSYYGGMYKKRKRYEIHNNQSGKLSEKATESLTLRNIQDPATRACYLGESHRCAHTNPALAGFGTPLAFVPPIPHMPPGRIDQRAARWTYKLYASHWHGIAFRARYGAVEPLPYPIAFGDHVHYLEIPDLPDNYRFPRSTGGPGATWHSAVASDLALSLEYPIGKGSPLIGADGDPIDIDTDEHLGE